MFHPLPNGHLTRSLTPTRRPGLTIKIYFVPADPNSWKASDASAPVGTGARGNGGSHLPDRRSGRFLRATQLTGTLC